MKLVHLINLIKEKRHCKKIKMSMSKVDLCVVFGLKAKVNLVFCWICGKWIDDICGGEKIMVQKNDSILNADNMTIDMTQEQEKMKRSCDVGETEAHIFSWLGQHGQKCKVAATVRTQLM